MKWMFICISSLLFIVGCGSPDEDGSEDGVKNEKLPNVVFIKNSTTRR